MVSALSKSITLALLAAVWLAPSRSDAKKDCDSGDIQVISSFPFRQLNTPPNPQVNFTVQRRRPSTECSYWVGFTKGVAPTYDRKLRLGADELDYDIFKTPTSAPTTLKSYPDATSLSEVYTGAFVKGGGSPNQHIYTSHPQMVGPLPGPFNVKPPGFYSDSLTIKVFEGAFPPAGVPIELASVPQQYSYVVSPFALVSLLDTGIPYTDPPITLKTLNFGTMTTGQELTFDMVLLFNSGYRVTFASQNGSRLRHQSALTYVDYEMSVGGVPQALSAGAPVEVVSGAGQSPSAPTGFRVPVKIKIGSIAQGFGGTYTDSVTVVVTSL